MALCAPPFGFGLVSFFFVFVRFSLKILKKLVEAELGYKKN